MRSVLGFRALRSLLFVLWREALAGMSDVPVVIVSHKRAGRVLTLQAIRPAILCVEKSQRKAYAESHPGVEIVTHPDSVIGLSAKRQWVYKHFGDVLMVDDDCPIFKRLMEPPERLVPDAAYDAVQHVALMARDYGAYLWGFAMIGDARNYKPHSPFKTTGYVNGLAVGIFKGSRLWWPDDERLTAEDYWVSALNAHYHRKVWLDTRFAFWQGHAFESEGGLAEFRSMQTEEWCYSELRRNFGDAIRSRRAGHGRDRPFQKQLVVPW